MEDRTEINDRSFITISQGDTLFADVEEQYHSGGIHEFPREREICFACVLNLFLQNKTENPKMHVEKIPKQYGSDSL